MSKIKTVGIAGTGLIGAGWAARLLIRGFDVIAYDVHPAAEAKLRAAIDVAWPSMSKLLGSSGKKGKLSFTTDLKEMASKADFIHEAAPEREDLKVKLFRDIDAIATARRYHFVVVLRLPAHRAAIPMPAPRAGDHRPPLQPGLSPAPR